mgnify:CR=1 FL=1
MSDATDLIVARIEANPKYHELRRKRNRLGWTLTVLMLIVYYGFIGMIAFDKAFLAQPIGDGVTTIGIPIGVGVIVSAFILTGIYVARANSTFDDLTAQIVQKVKK